MKDTSRLYRLLVLVASVVTIAYLIGAAARENYFAQWKVVQRGYRDLLREKATDDRSRELLSKFQVEMKQTSIPALGTVDRCVSCHNGIDDPRMKDVGLPHQTHPGGILDMHPVDKFGCTICHRGQGAAMTFREAKADDVYWDYPLLPPELTEASCATCHDIETLPKDQVRLLTEGMRLYKEKGCGSCHKLDGRGGALGPVLDNEGAKTKHQLTRVALKPPYTTWNWYSAHFRDPGKVVAGSQMPNPTVTEQEALALTAYMLAHWKRDVPESYLAPDKIAQKDRALHPTPLTGAQVYQQYCAGCHGSGTYTRWNKKFARFIPAIRGASLIVTATPEYLRQNIENGRPGTQMPAWNLHAGGLMPEEAAAVADYLRGNTKQMPDLPSLSLQGDASRGLRLYQRNCVGCHGKSGRGGIAPEIGNPVFLAAAGDGFLLKTIREGRTQTPMPAFQRPDGPVLGDQDLADLLAYLHSLGKSGKQQAATNNGSPLRSAGGKS